MNGKYSVKSSIGMDGLSRRNTEVTVTKERVTVETQKSKQEIELGNIHSISNSFLIAPLSLILMLLVTGLDLFIGSMYHFNVVFLIISCVCVVILACVSINHRVQIILKDGTIVNIDAAKGSIASELYGDITGQEACSAEQTSKVNVLEIVIALVVAVFIALSAYMYVFDDANINAIKNATSDEYPGVTYGEAFEEYFNDPTWKSFVSEDGIEVVEFNGSCEINGSTSEVVVQYDKDGDTFNFQYFGINGVSSNYDAYMTLLKVIFQR